MKRGRASSSDDDAEAEVQSLSVSDYHLVDDEDVAVSFAVLPIQWSDSESSAASEGKVFLRGFADDGPRKIFTQVTAWRFDLSNVRPEMSLLSKDGRWIKLQKPRKSFQDTVRTILTTLHFLHRVKKKRQMSAVSVWQDLCKDKELSSYGFKPSQNDLLDHVPLIGEAAKRHAVLVKSKLLLMVLEKLKSQKLLDKEVNNLAQPGLTLVGIDSDMIDESNEESDERDNLDVCALCDNGGNVACCDGVCMRSFHATEEAGRENNCVSLGFTQKEVDEIQSFYCKNCEYRQHQCFACGKLGSSDKVKGAEVIKCASATCDRFYHPHCVAKLLPQVVKHVAEELERNIADGDPFTCPLHYCCVCKELENKMDPELQFAVCRRCPKSYHRKCLPRNHEIDHELGTPIRDHIKFPNMKSIVQEINTTTERKKPATKERVILKKKNVNLDNSSGKSTAKGSKLTGKLSSDKVVSNKSNKMISGSNISRKPKSKEPSRRCSTDNKRSISEKFEMPDCEQNHNQPTVGEKLYALKNEGLERIEHDNQVNNVITKSLFVKPPLDAYSKKSLLALFKEARSSITMKSVLEKHTFASTHTHSLRNVVEKTITMGKLEGSVDAVRTALRKLESGCSIQDVEAVCDPDVLKQIFMWKDKLKIYLAPVLYGNRYTSYGRHFTLVEKLEGIVDKLHWYVQNSDMIVDFCCGANDFSILLKKKLEETEKKCSYRNYDLLPTKNDFSFERRDWMTVQPTELPTGSQLIMGLNPPFGRKAASANKFIDKALEFKPKLLILIVPPETERLDKKLSPYDLIWEDENFLSGTSFYLPGSVDVSDKQMDQRNVRPPLLSLWSRPDWTPKHKVIAQEHGHVCRQHELLETESFNTDMLAAADHATDGNYADNLKSTDDREHQASISEGQKRSFHYGNVDKESQEGQQYRMGKSGKSPRKRKHIEENNRTLVGVVSPAKRKAVNGMPEGVPDHSQPNPINGRPSGEGLRPKSVAACPRVEVDGLSGDDPSCGHLGNNNEQVVSVPESSCKTNTPAIGRCEPRLGELNHGKRSSLGSQPRTFSKSDTLGRSVPPPGNGGGLRGFASGTNYVYARQHSCGWLDE
ncbi:ENHANCED DOWNY MILDEW 2 [Spatholobus suberectus]|nr:ENHANCED DOWNY MILDEW 2 [Spatholobus suberectus]